MDDIKLYYNETTGAFEQREEPYAVVEFQTKEDFDLFNEMVRFYQENHKQEEGFIDGQ